MEPSGVEPQMNCNKGDLALIFRSPGNAGKMVTCLELVPQGTQRCHDQSPLWRVDRPVIWMNWFGDQHHFNLCPDRIMMPIRPQDEGVQLYTETHS
jgi:hypothetical protein